jgi:hypothetical protein
LYRRRDKFQQCDRHAIICDGADMDDYKEKANSVIEVCQNKPETVEVKPIADFLIKIDETPVLFISWVYFLRSTNHSHT